MPKNPLIPQSREEIPIEQCEDCFEIWVPGDIMYKRCALICCFSKVYIILHLNINLFISLLENSLYQSTVIRFQQPDCSLLYRYSVESAFLHGTLSRPVNNTPALKMAHWMIFIDDRSLIILSLFFKVASVNRLSPQFASVSSEVFFQLIKAINNKT